MRNPERADNEHGRERERTNQHGDPDPPTGQPGAHPIGTGAGAVGGAAAGAAIGGAVGGPAGAAIGGIAGAIGGGAAGRGLGEAIKPSDEDRHWRQNYQSRPYTDDDALYDLYRPAYRFGWEARIRYFDRAWPDVESNLAHQWEQRHESELTWARARPAAHDAWQRVDRQMRNMQD